MRNLTAALAPASLQTTPVAILHLRHSKGGGGGADAVLLQDLSVLDKARFQTGVVYLRKHREQPSRMIQRLRDVGVPCYDHPGNAVVDVRQLLRIARLVARTGTRILHCHDPKSDIYGYLLRLFRPGLRLVCTLHGWTVKVRREALYNWATVLVLRRFDAILAVSESLRRRAETESLPGVHVIPNAIDVESWQRPDGAWRATPPGKKGIAIGFVGRLSPEKGPLNFVRTVRRVSERAADCEFFVAGEGPERPAMEALAASLHVADRIRFLGHLNEEELRALYRRLDMVLLTSHTEGLPMVILEALAMSLPVVATRVGGVGEIVRDGVNGLLAEQGDIEGLATAVLRLVDSAALRVSLGVEGRKGVVTRFSLPARIAALESLYQGLLPVR
jgi:glycosyltransferase involved in cell wall biosynthesis